MNDYTVESGEVLLVNLKTGKTRKIDGYSLRGGYRPDGYVIAEDLSVKDWCEAIKNAAKR